MSNHLAKVFHNQKEKVNTILQKRRDAPKPVDVDNPM